MKCVVIVSAFKAQSTIVDCVKTIQSQKLLPGWEYEIRVGVDGCSKTSARLQHAKIPFYYTRQNFGTYIMANSLLALGPADIYARFDADDFMFPNYLETVIPVALDHGICFAAHRHGRKHSKPRVGQVTFTAETLEALGGFAHYRCHCDRDFARRARMLGIDIKAARRDPRMATALFIKGMSRNSLTRNPKTGGNSKYRRRARHVLGDARAKGVIKVNPKTVELKSCRPKP